MPLNKIKFTAEEKEAFKNKRLEAKAKLTLAYQLGFYVGEEIVRKYLPTLSCDSITTNTIIQVKISEADELRRLNNVWFNKYHSIKGNDVDRGAASEGEWKELMAYQDMLEAKYLPKTVECHFSLLNISEKDMIDFKKGINHSLWDCDCSRYSSDIENIEVKEDDNAYFTIITLKKVENE